MADAMDAPRTSDAEPLLRGLARFAVSSVGSKVLMALTGLGLSLFIVAHLVGNLTLWAGQATMNHYAAALKGSPPLLWGERAALLLAIPLHVLAAIRAARLNRKARPIGYSHEPLAPASDAGKSMLLTGLVVVTFLGYHLAHLTWHLTNPEQVTLLEDGTVDVYSMVVRGFQVPWIAAIYIIGQLLLAQHLSHGISSLFQHLGIWGPAWTPFIKKISLALGYGLCAAFISLPVGVLAGAIRLP